MSLNSLTINSYTHSLDRLDAHDHQIITANQDYKAKEQSENSIKRKFTI